MPAGEQPVEPAEQVVPGDDADLELSGEAQRAGRRGHGLGAGAWVHATGIRRDLDAALGQRGEDPLHERDEVGGVAQRWVARFLLLHDGHRHLGEVVHHQVIDRAAGHLAVRRFEPVAPKALPGRDPNGGGKGRSLCRHERGTTRRTASAPAPCGGCTRSSMSGAKPSGSVSSGVRTSGSTAPPPATTETSEPSPSGLASRSRKRTRAPAPHARAPRAVTSTLRSAPSSASVNLPPVVALPGLEASSPVSARGATSARTVALTPESGAAITSSSYTPGTISSACTTNRPVPGSERPSCTSSSSRNGCPFGSYSRAVARCSAESGSVTVATRVAPGCATRRK